MLRNYFGGKQSALLISKKDKAIFYSTSKPLVIFDKQEMPNCLKKHFVSITQVREIRINEIVVLHLTTIEL